ncbi:MAG: hypothetical protein KJ018_18550 [Burkholderiales bacterium]|nr:hypothetical protein [Burkholderiales bacterium]
MDRGPKSILDPAFRYTPAAATDLRKTFARIRREQRKAREQEQAKRVIPIKRVPA